MLDKVKLVLDEVLSFKPKNPEDLEQFRIQFLGKRGKMTNLFADFKKVPNDQKKILAGL